MQSLLDEISGLPSLLQRLDVISRSGQEHQKEEIAALYKAFDTQLLRLEEWEANLKISTNSRVLWWPVASSPDHETPFPISYEFANILVANTMSHYWSFLSVIQISISSLLTLSKEKGVDVACLLKQRATISPENRVALAKDICQSMRYHLQPEMGLYGPAATLYPINMALQIFREENKMKEVIWCENFISKLETMGILLASHIPSVETGTKKPT